VACCPLAIRGEWRGRWVTRDGVNHGGEELFGGAECSDLEAVEVEGAAIELVTRCSSVEEFIDRFARFATETDIVVPALPHVSVGNERHFAIGLKDGTVVMKGRCEVTEVLPVAGAPAAAPASSAPALMRLRLREMDAHSCGIHLRLMERHVASSPVADVRPDAPASPVAAPTPSTVTDVSEVTVVSDATSASPADNETTAVSPLPRPEARVPGAAMTLPANPLSDLDAADLATFIEHTLLESSAQADQTQTRIAPSARARRWHGRDARIAGARRTARRVAPYAACLIAGVVVGFAARSGSRPAPVVAAPAVAAAPAPVRPATPAPPEDEPPIFAPRDCIARVTTRPAGAEVSWGDIALGASPIERAAIPCGTAVVTFRRERYAEATLTITTERGRGAVVAHRLQRPAAKMVVTSSPPNALIKLNKRRLGRAPRDVNAQRFERVRLEASLPGYQPWKKTVYLEEAESNVDVRLVRKPEAGVRRAPQPAATAQTGAVSPTAAVVAPAAVAAR
jgi:hypothetical protein